jgi:hypothetical protein
VIRIDRQRALENALARGNLGKSTTEEEVYGVWEEFCIDWHRACNHTVKQAFFQRIKLTLIAPDTRIRFTDAILRTHLDGYENRKRQLF